MSQNKEETINNKIELSISNEYNNQISEENNSLNIINKGANDYIKLSNSIESIEGKKVNLMKRIEYIDIIETIAIFFVVYIHNNTILEIQVWLI